MSDDIIYEKVKNALATEFELDTERLAPEAHIRDDLGLDSLDIVDMVIVLEKTFDFKLNDRLALAGIQTVGDICNFIKSLNTSEPHKQ